MYIHIHIYTYIHIYIYTYTHIYIRTYIHTYITLHYITLHYITYIHIHTYTCLHVLSRLSNLRCQLTQFQRISPSNQRSVQVRGLTTGLFDVVDHSILRMNTKVVTWSSLSVGRSGWTKYIIYIYIYISVYVCIYIYICVYIYIEYINMCIHNWNRQPVLLRSGHAGWNPAPKGDRQRSTPLWLKPRISISTLIFRSDLPPHKNPEMSLDHGFPPKKKCQKRFLHRNSLPQSPLIKAPSWSENQVTAAELELPLPVVLLPRSFTTTWWRLPRLPQ